MKPSIPKPLPEPRPAAFVLPGIWVLFSLLLSSQLGCSATPSADMKSRPEGRPVEYQWNCGLNVGYIGLRLFSKDVDIYELAHEINAGPRLGRGVSMLDLKRAFEKHGLVAQGFRADYPQEIIALSEPDNILIVRLESVPGDQSTGHFVLIKGGRNHATVVDPPCRPKRFSKEDIIEKGVLSSASGEFLVLRNE